MSRNITADSCDQRNMMVIIARRQQYQFIEIYKYNIVIIIVYNIIIQLHITILLKPYTSRTVSLVESTKIYMPQK